MGEFRMPSLGADMDQGTLVEWRVAVGDHVRRGDIVASVDTDKAVIDVEVFENGIVEELLVEQGATVPVGTPLARLGPAERVEAAERVEQIEQVEPAERVKQIEQVEPAERVKQIEQVEPADAGAHAHPTPAAGLPGGPGRHQASVLLSPLVRHLAEELGVNPNRVSGTGIGGSITRSDVEQAAARRAGRASPRARRRAREEGLDLARAHGSGPDGTVHERDVLAALAATRPADGRPDAGSPTSTPASPTTDRRAASRRAAARTMERSNREIPHFHLASTVDMEPAMAWLALRNDARPPAERLIPAVLLLRAAALAARSVPDLNGWWVDEELVAAPEVDLGVVVALRGGGLVTPTITGADRGALEDLMGALREAVERARQGSLRSSDLAEASMTVTNLGDRGAEVVHGVIHPPQVALVGYGRIVERPWATNGEVTARRTVTTSLAADHRASDGHQGSRFLTRIAQLLSSPDLLTSADEGATDAPTTSGS